MSTDSSYELEGGDARPDSPKAKEEQDTIAAATD